MEIYQKTHNIQFISFEIQVCIIKCPYNTEILHFAIRYDISTVYFRYSLII